MAKIHIIVGTVTGTALEVAEAIAATLAERHHCCRINTQFQPGQLTDKTDEVLLLCTSNTGMGDLPANIAPLYHHLTVDCPRIVGRRYGIVNLGDSSYPNFAQAGQTLDDAMTDIGAQRIGEPCVLDAMVVDRHADDGQAWARQWEQHL